MSTPVIGAVVIGRNEGERLVRCLQSVLKEIPIVAYVDSGSKDESVERARQLGVIAIPLQEGPYTAARGRQTGFIELAARHPELAYVMFIDGDCLLQPGFVKKAVEYLEANPKTCGVSGRRREEGANTWSRIIDVEWDIPSGSAEYIGGDSLFRVAALKQCGGWAPELIAGEEPDLCFRCRDLGWTCWRIPDEMSLHDIRMNRLGEYWKRSVRAGHAYVEVSLRRRHGYHGRWMKQTLSILLYAAALPVVGIALTLVWWPLGLVLVLGYARLAWSIYRWSRARGRDGKLSAIVSGLTILGKFAGLVGVAKYATGRLSGKRVTIIEYKAGASQESADSALPNNP